MTARPRRVTVAAAARLLGVSDRRIRQRLADPNDVLEGVRARDGWHVDLASLDLARNLDPELLDLAIEVVAAVRGLDSRQRASVARMVSDPGVLRRFLALEARVDELASVVLPSAGSGSAP